jgi:hypothetical protein
LAAEILLLKIKAMALSFRCGNLGTHGGVLPNEPQGSDCAEQGGHTSGELKRGIPSAGRPEQRPPAGNYRHGQIGRFGFIRDLRERPREFDLPPSLRRYEEPRFERTPLFLRQFTAHVRIDQVRFSSFQSVQVFPVLESLVLHPDLFFLSQIS